MPENVHAGGRLCWCLFLLCTSWCVQGGVQIAETPSAFTAADPRDPKYIIGLSDKDKNGKKYRCSLPAVPTKPEPALSSSEVGIETTSELDIPAKTPFELLDSLAAMCLYRQEGQWTYEMCYKKHVRQFRQENSKIAEEHVCGAYLGDEAQTEEIKLDTSSAGPPTKYVSHVMGKGGPCVMTGAARTAEVRFTCLREASENILTSVKEFPTCNYLITVSTPFLCKHAQFKPAPDQLSMINCHPLAPPERGPLPSSDPRPPAPPVAPSPLLEQEQHTEL